MEFTNAPPQILRIKRKRGTDPLQALILEESQRTKRSKPSSPVSSKPRSPVSGLGNNVVSGRDENSQQQPNRQNHVLQNSADPEALVAKVRSWYFQLSGTDDQVAAPDAETLASVLAEASSSRDNRQFVIPKSQTEADTVIPNELSEMLSSFLSVSDQGGPKRKRRGNRGSAENSTEPQYGAVEEVTEEETASDDYVFDVYKLSSTEPLTDQNYPSSQIGFIRFFDDHEYDLMQSDDENGSPTQVYSEDEDSNAESFYQNDYPEDEDAGTYSDTYEPKVEGESDEEYQNEQYGKQNYDYDDAYDNDDEYGDVGPVIIDTAEDLEGQAYLAGHVQADLVKDGQFDDLYDDFFDENDENRIDFLQQAEDSGEETFERQKFFAGEEDDAMAIHRDRIFGRLQRMIDEAD